MVECTLSITHCLRLNLQLHTIDLVRTCRVSSFCTVRGSWQDFNWNDASRGPSAIAELLVADWWCPFCCTADSVRSTEKTLDKNDRLIAHRKLVESFFSCNVLYGTQFVSIFCVFVRAYQTSVNFSISIDVYCSGWLFKLEVKNMDELKALMDEKAYADYLENKDDHDK